PPGSPIDSTPNPPHHSLCCRCLSGPCGPAASAHAAVGKSRGSWSSRKSAAPTSRSPSQRRHHSPYGVFRCLRSARLPAYRTACNQSAARQSMESVPWKRPRMKRRPAFFSFPFVPRREKRRGERARKPATAERSYALYRWQSNLHDGSTFVFRSSDEENSTVNRRWRRCTQLGYLVEAVLAMT